MIAAQQEGLGISSEGAEGSISLVFGSKNEKMLQMLQHFLTQSISASAE